MPHYIQQIICIQNVYLSIKTQRNRNNTLFIIHLTHFIFRIRIVYPFWDSFLFRYFHEILGSWWIRLDCWCLFVADLVLSFCNVLYCIMIHPLLIHCSFNPGNIIIFILFCFIWSDGEPGSCKLTFIATDGFNSLILTFDLCWLWFFFFLCIQYNNVKQLNCRSNNT